VIWWPCDLTHYDTIGHKDQAWDTCVWKLSEKNKYVHTCIGLPFCFNLQTWYIVLNLRRLLEGYTCIFLKIIYGFDLLSISEHYAHCVVLLGFAGEKAGIITQTSMSKMCIDHGGLVLEICRWLVFLVISFPVYFWQLTCQVNKCSRNEFELFFIIILV